MDTVLISPAQALQAAAAATGVSVKWYPVSSQTYVLTAADLTTSDMERIAQDAMQNQPPIEY